MIALRVWLKPRGFLPHGLIYLCATLSSECAYFPMKRDTNRLNIWFLVITAFHDLGEVLSAPVNDVASFFVKFSSM